MSEENSNFHQLLKLRAQENPEIIEWLRKRDDKYTPSEIQNEILEAMALGMMRQISANIQNATFFTIMADETADVSNKEHNCGEGSPRHNYCIHPFCFCNIIVWQINIHSFIFAFSGLTTVL